ncbi:MAG: hypothetical protein ABSD62_10595 [Candidatus Limnocylindrales bacterium]
MQLEHPVHDFGTWKAAFDRDPVDREASGVRTYQIYRPTDDPNYIAVDLEFDSLGKAEAFKLALQELWRSPKAAAAFAGIPRVRVVDIVERKSY